MSSFSNPAPAGDNYPLADILGHYVLVRPLSYETEVPTVHGPKDAIKVNVADLTVGEHRNNVLWFSGYVVGSLKNQLGQFVLAQVTQGQAKPGQSAPWLLEGCADNPEVVQAAEKWLAANPGVLEGTPPISSPAPAAGIAPPPSGGLAPQLA